MNDDIIQGGKGFGTHPHGNMEIISIPLMGSLAHEDSIGNSGIIETGEVQVMSAGTGIEHSEFNASQEEPTNFLQIWIKPDTRKVAPRYDQMSYNLESKPSAWINLVRPRETKEAGLWIHQQAYIDLMLIKEPIKQIAPKRKKENGILLMVLDGELQVNEETLGSKDAIALPPSDQEVTLLGTNNTKVLKIETPPNGRGRF